MWNQIPLLTPFIRARLRAKKEHFPKLVSIEMTSKCNSNCIMCPRVEMSRGKIHMKPEILNKIIADCKGKPVKKINLFWFGDSLVNKEFIAYTRLIRKELPKAKLYLSTNAEFLTAEWAELILEENLIDVLNIDIDGTTKETYEKIRVGVNFDTVVANTNYFLDRKKALNKKLPQTRCTIIEMDQTAHEVEEFRQTWGPKVDRLEVTAYNTWLGTQEERNIGEKLEQSKAQEFHTVCDHPWNQLVIGADGRAGLCPLDFDLTAPVGQVMDSSIQEIWQGKQMTDYRTKLINYQYKDIDCCSQCNAHIYQTKSLWSKVWAK